MGVVAKGEMSVPMWSQVSGVARGMFKGGGANEYDLAAVGSYMVRSLPARGGALRGGCDLPSPLADIVRQTPGGSCWLAGEPFYPVTAQCTR